MNIPFSRRSTILFIMRNGWGLVFIFMLQTLLMACQFRSSPTAPVKLLAGTAARSAPLPEIKTNLLAYTFSLPEEDLEEPLYVHHSFMDHLFDLVQPEALEKYEGSYSTHDLLHQNPDKSKSFGLKSSWIVGHSSLPEAGIHVARNPATGKYEVDGGEIFLPTPGIGVSYEMNERTGEKKTFLNWKNTF